MLYWASVFLVIALIAGLFGFSGFTSAIVAIAQVLFFLFIIGFSVSIVLHIAKAINKKTDA